MVQPPDGEMTMDEDRAATGSRRAGPMVNLACGFGVFAGAMFAFFTVRLVVEATAVPAESQVFMLVAVIAGIIVTLLLLAGTVTMWTRQPVGQTILIIASALGIAYAVSFTVYNYFHGPSAYGAGDFGVVVAQTLFGLIPPVVTLGCAAAAASSPAIHR